MWTDIRGDNYNTQDTSQENAYQSVASSKFYTYYTHLATCSICIHAVMSLLLMHDTDYLDDLLAETILQCTCVETSRPMNIPEPLCSGYERPDKDLAVTRHRSRFILN